MKREVVEFVARCMVCQKVKIEHRRPRVCCSPYLYQLGSSTLSRRTFPRVSRVVGEKNVVWVIGDRATEKYLVDGGVS